MSLRIPFVFWPSKPDHIITGISKSLDGQTLVSSDMNGILVKWISSSHHPATKKYIPKFLMIASSGSPSISVCQALSHERNFAVSGLCFFIIFY